MNLYTAKVQNNAHFICLFEQMYVTALFNNGANSEVHMYMADEWMSDDHRWNYTDIRELKYLEGKIHFHCTSASG